MRLFILVDISPFLNDVSLPWEMDRYSRLRWKFGVILRSL